MVIIGITGTIGAGKGEMVSYLKHQGFLHFSARDFLVGEMVKRNISMNRGSMTDLADDLRKTHSSSYIIERLYSIATAQGHDAVIESIRAIGEVDFLRKMAKEHKSPIFLIAIDADPKIRYERIVARKSELDHISFEKFVSDDAREINSPDSTKGNIHECMRRADFTIMNNRSRNDLEKQVGEIVEKIVLLSKEVHLPK